MTPLISVLLPTRHRPALATAFLDSLARTAADPGHLEIILYVDADDPASAAVTDARLRVVPVVGPPTTTMGAMMTAALARAGGDVVLLANDDIAVRSAGWDTQLRATHVRYADGIYLAWPNDAFSSRRMSTFPILSRTACDLLIEPFPVVYRGAFIDYELFDIFTRLRRLGHDRLVYLEDVLFEHLHHRTGKRDADDTSRRRGRFDDDPAFLSRSAARQRQAERLAAVIERRAVPPPLTAPAPPAPASLWAAAQQFATTFLGDRGLPTGRRLYLFGWYCGRYIAARLARRNDVLP